MFYNTFLLKNLVVPKKGSNFAPDLKKAMSDMHRKYEC